MGREKVDQKSLKDALEFLHHDPQGKTILRVEHTLTLMQAGLLPKFQKLLFDTSYNLGKPASHKNKTERAMAKVQFHNCALKFSLYHCGIPASRASYYASAFGQIIAITYAALGVDMSGFPSKFVPPKTFDKTDKEKN